MYDYKLNGTKFRKFRKKNLTAVGFEPTPVYTDQNTLSIKLLRNLSLAPWTARPYCLEDNVLLRLF